MNFSMIASRTMTIMTSFVKYEEVVSCNNRKIVIKKGDYVHYRNIFVEMPRDEIYKLLDYTHYVHFKENLCSKKIIKDVKDSMKFLKKHVSSDYIYVPIRIPNTSLIMQERAGLDYRSHSKQPSTISDKLYCVFNCVFYCIVLFTLCGWNQILFWLNLDD